MTPKPQIATQKILFSHLTCSLVRLQRRIYGANLALRYFIRTHWVFKNAKFLELNSFIKPEEEKDFRFDKFITDDVRKYFINCMYGKCYAGGLWHSNEILFLSFIVKVHDVICYMKKTKTYREQDEYTKGNGLTAISKA